MLDNIIVIITLYIIILVLADFICTIINIIKTKISNHKYVMQENKDLKTVLNKIINHTHLNNRHLLLVIFFSTKIIVSSILIQIKEKIKCWIIMIGMIYK